MGDDIQKIKKALEDLQTRMANSEEELRTIKENQKYILLKMNKSK